jgi:hypothetical protein
VPVDVRFLPRLHRFLAGQGDGLIGDLRAALSTATRLLLGEVRVTVGDPLLSVPPSPRGGRSGLTPEVP